MTLIGSGIPGIESCKSFGILDGVQGEGASVASPNLGPSFAAKAAPFDFAQGFDRKDDKLRRGDFPPRSFNDRAGSEKPKSLTTTDTKEHGGSSRDRKTKIYDGGTETQHSQDREKRLRHHPSCRLRTRCFIKCGLGRGQKVQQHQAEDHTADSADEKKRHHVGLERVGLSGPHPGKHGLL